MKISRKLVLRILIYIFFLFTLISLLRLNSVDWDLKEVKWIDVVIDFVFLPLIWLLIFVFIKNEKEEIYLKKEEEEKVLMFLVKIDAILIKEKGNRRVYKIPGENWPYKRIVMIKDSYFIRLKVAHKYSEVFIKEFQTI